MRFAKGLAVMVVLGVATALGMAPAHADNREFGKTAERQGTNWGGRNFGRTQVYAPMRTMAPATGERRSFSAEPQAQPPAPPAAAAPAPAPCGCPCGR